MVEESVSSVLVFWKVPAGINLTTTSLNPSSSVKDKAVTSSINNAVTTKLSLKNSALVATEVVPLKEDLVEDAKAIPRPTDADISILKLITIAKTLMLLIMLDSPTWKLTEELPTASALKVT